MHGTSVTVGQVRHGSGQAWEYAFSSQEELFPDTAISQAREYLSIWQGLFSGDTWVKREHNVPSFIVRLDCVVHDGELQVYEIEERPCGLGMIPLCNPFFGERLAAHLSKWPEIRWVAGPGRDTDDELAFGSPLSLQEALRYDGPLLVRSRPEDHEFHALENRSVSSISREGDKRYGVEMGWWDEITARMEFEDRDRVYVTDPSLSDPCVIKPRRGTRCNLVKVVMRAKQREALRDRGIIVGKGDCESPDQVAKLIFQQPHRTMYRQPLIVPLKLSHQPDKNAIFRMYFGYDPNAKEWTPLGGMWMALNSLIVHGTNNTVTGPLIFRD